MQLPTLTWSALLGRMAASVQGSAGALIDLSVGSVLRAILEASASVGLWMQYLILQVLTATRAATSAGADLDSWMADFSFTRLPGAAASGVVTFSRYTPGIVALIPVGTTVMTFDGTQSFTVVEQDNNPAWNGAAYEIGAAQASADLPVVAVNAGSAGNVLPGAIGILTAAIAGVDTVSNAAPFGGGVDAESDVAFRDRFTLFINSRTAATLLAIEAAIAGVQGGLRFVVFENQDAAQDVVPGSFAVVVDDGSGAPPAALITAVSTAIDRVRPVGARFSVSGPARVPVTVEATIETAPGADHGAIAIAAEGAVQGWIAGLPVGGTLAISKIEALIHGVSPAVISVGTTSINGQGSDVSAAGNAVLMANGVVVG